MTRAWIAAAVLAVACTGKRGTGFTEAAGAGSGHGGHTGSGHGSSRHGPETVLPRLTGWEPTCAKAFETARAAAPFERFAILARGCPVCSVDWQPVLKANELDEHESTAAAKLDVDAVVKACGGACSSSARDQFLSAFDLVKDAQTMDRPWRRLAKDCKDLLWPAPNDRFANASWYILSQIGRALVGQPGPTAKLTIGAPLELPLPAAHVNGGGLRLTTATEVLPEVAARQITVMTNDVRIAAPPMVTVAADGLHVNVTADFPGAPVAMAGVDAALAPVAGGKVAVLAPIASPAVRVLELVRAIKSGVELHLAAFVPSTATGWPDVPGMLAPVLSATAPAGDHVVLGVGGDDGVRVGTASAGGAVRDACIDPEPLAALLHAKPTSGSKVAIAILDGATVEHLAGAIDAVGTAHIGAVALAGSDAVKWPPDLAPCPK
jgi:hypothetical protein